MEQQCSYSIQESGQRMSRTPLSSSPTTWHGGVYPWNAFARNPFLAFEALSGEHACWVRALEVDVAYHRACTVRALVVDVRGKWACKFLESITTFRRRRLWPFAPACDDCVVLGLKVHRAV